MHAHFAVRLDYFHFFDTERFGAILRKLTCEYGNHDLGSRVVRCSDIYENVLRIKRNLSRLRIDDRRQRKDCAVLVVENRVAWLVFDNAKVLLQFLIILKHTKEVTCVHLLVLLERLEYDFLGWQRLVGDWKLNFV